MQQTILSIAGKPGLFKLVSRGRANLIVESLDEQHKRMPAFSTDRVEKITAYCTGQMPKPEPAAKKEDLLNRLNLLRRAF